MKKTFSWLLPALLVGLTSLIMWLNFEPGAWLTGWDTLHPEFNYSLNLSRVINGAWREDQGLGTLAKHAHLAELPRIIILWLLDLLLPTQNVRYALIALCFVLGPLGIYFLLKKTILPETKNSHYLASFLGALFYLFNLGTVQHFVVVFEMFAVQYAALGWLFWQATRYWQKPNKKTALILLGLFFVSAPMAYASQLWFAFSLSLGLYLLTKSLLTKHKTVKLKISLVISLLLIAANAFWLLPNLYFLASGQGKILAESHINRLFSPESYYQNAAYGNLKDSLLLKNFLFNWQFFDHQTQQFQPLLESWGQHLQRPCVLAIGFTISGFVLLGFLLSLVKKKKEVIAFLPILLLSFALIANQVWPVAPILNYLREASTLIKEGLRTPYTKFSLLLMMSGSIFLSFAIKSLFEVTQKFWKNWLLPSLISLILAVSLSYYGWPMFQGQLIHPLLQQQIPDEYFALYDFMQTQPTEARLAVLPFQSLFGWEYYRWGYEGAGFIWFGLPQSVLVRDFDRWNPDNEAFYNQAAHALNTEDQQAFLKTLAKYDVNYVLLDKNILNPNHPEDQLGTATINDFLTTGGAEIIWHEANLSLWQLPRQTNDYLKAPESFQVVSHQSIQPKIADILYQTQDSYLEVEGASSYPLTHLSSLQEKTALENNQVNFELLTENETGRLTVPTLIPGKYYSVQTELKLLPNELILSFAPLIELKGQKNIALFQLPETKVSLDQTYTELYIQVNGKQILIKQDETLIKNLSLVANEPIQINLFSPENVDQNSKTVAKQAIKTSTINHDVWQAAQLTTPKIFDLTGPINYQPHLVHTVAFIDEDHIKNCDQQTRGQITTTKKNDHLIYRAQNDGALCQSIYINQLGSGWHWLRIRGQNLSGRSLKTTLSSIQGENIIEDLMPINAFDQLLPFFLDYQMAQDGLVLTLQTQSYNQIESQNLVEKIEFYQAPLEQLALLQLGDKKEKTNNKLKLIEETRLANYYYNLHSQIGGQLVLSQGFDSAWLAWSQPGNKPWFALNSYQRLAHSRFNGWANSWQVPDGEQKVIILYWPQLLVFGGYLLLVTTGSCLIYRFLRE